MNDTPSEPYDSRVFHKQWMPPMKRILLFSATLAGLALVSAGFAKNAAPAGSTGVCKDGTFTSAASKQGACHGHQGVKEWFPTAAPPAAATPVAPAPSHKTTSPAAAAHPTNATPTTASRPAAPAPASAGSAGASGICNDGTYSNAASKQGACHGHQGVKQWFGEGSPASAAVAPATTAPAPRVAPAPAPAPAATAAAAPARSPVYTPAAGAVGGGQVWANKSTKVYHCPGDQWYGKTKEGAYMSESAAVAAGYHADHGKACGN